MNQFQMNLSVASIPGGVFALTLVPFHSDGTIDTCKLSAQAKTFNTIPGIHGVAVVSTSRERRFLNHAEQMNVITASRMALSNDKMVLSCVGDIGASTIDTITEHERAGANAAVAILEENTNYRAIGTELLQLVETLNRSSLPIIIKVRRGQTSGPIFRDFLVAIAESCPRIAGFEIGEDDNVVQYDQDYYALKTVDRVLTILTGSDGALFHNLNTGCDGVLSGLAYIAPFEVASMYRAMQEGRVFDAQAVHLKLYPLVGLFASVSPTEREALYRYCAFVRGLTCTPYCREAIDPFSTSFLEGVQKTLDEVELTPLHQDVG